MIAEPGRIQELPGDRRPDGTFTKGNSVTSEWGKLGGRPPSKAERLGAVIEGLRRRYPDAVDAKDAIANLVRDAEADTAARLLMSILPKQEDPEAPTGDITIQLRAVGSTVDYLRPIEAAIPKELE